MLRSVFYRLRTLLHRNDVDARLDEEVQFHLDRQAEVFVRQGMRPSAARDAARRAFGNVSAAREAARSEVGIGWLDDLRQDMRYAARVLRRSPAFTFAATASLAIGIGANTAVFSATEALLLRRLAVPNPEALVSSHGGTYPLFRQIRELTSVFTGVAAVATIDRTNVSADQSAPDPALVRVSLVSGHYFETMGVRASLGRALGDEDDRTAGAHPVAVISESYRRRVLGSAINPLGHSISLNSTRYTVIGVMPRTFAGDAAGRPTDIWLPIMMQSQVMIEMPGLLTRNNGWLRIVARLQRHVTLAAARAAVQPVYRQNQLENAGSTPIPQLLRSLEQDPFILESIASGYSPQRSAITGALGILSGVVALVLLIACANVANLSLARVASRRREMATRLAIGAGRGRLVRQLLSESLLLSALGGAGGTLVAYSMTSLLSRTMSLGPVQMDSRNPSSWVSLDLRPDIRVLLVMAAVCLVCAFLFGIAPAVGASRSRLAGALVHRGADDGSRGGRFPLGHVLVGAQVALSFVLLFGAGLLLRTLVNLRHEDLGIDRQRVLLVWTSPAQAGRDTKAIARTVRAVIDRIASVPGVVAVSASNHGLLEGKDDGGASDMLHADGRPVNPGLGVMRDGIAPGFFRASGMRLIAGRDFTMSDDSVAPRVAIINETLARFLFGRGSAIGKRFGGPADTLEIVGVVHDAKHGSPRDARGVWYLPYAQLPSLMRSMCLVVRTSADPAALAPSIRLALQAVDPSLPILRIDTVQQQVNDVLFIERLTGSISTIFGAIALILSCVGLYGVISYNASRRTAEIGIRMALGASPHAIIRLVLGASATVVVAGLGAGFFAALLAGRVISARLYGVSASDSLTIISSAALLLGVACLAAYIPARRAAGLDPATALRAE